MKFNISVIILIMKRILLISFLTCAVFISSNMTANAFNLNFKKAQISYEKNIKLEEKQIRETMNSQLRFANKHNLEGLSSIYSNNFVNNDGFDKKVYLKLVEDTWETYPDISYNTEIKEIDINGNYASVEVYETAVAVAYDTINDVKIAGELNSFAKGIYHFEKVGNKWLMISENMLEETSTLKYGDARYLHLHLNVPKQIPAGKDYSSTLMIDAPKNLMAIGAISREKIVYPQNKPDESFRVLSDDNRLERIFTANDENVNEYNIASVAIARSLGEGDDAKVYMNGAAFVMTRINVIPQNTMIKLEEENAKAK